MVSRFERFSLAISEISRHWHKIAGDEMEKYGLKGPHSVYLLCLSRYPQGITAAKLCELCGKDKADASRMMSIMQQKGLVVKEGSSYRALIKLTDEGEAAAEHVRQRAAKAVELAGGCLSEEHRTILYDSLELITANLRRISEDGLPL